MFNVNLTQLAKILDIGQFSLYPKLKTFKSNDIGNYKIDLDDFLISHKINDFEFIHEITGGSFSDRLVTLQNQRKEQLSAKEVKAILDINDYKLSQLRKHNEIEAVKLSKTRYLYDYSSIEAYMAVNQLNNHTSLYSMSKQFYSPNEIMETLSKYNIELSLKSVYRYIYRYNKIPCVKVSGNLRIPILEFNKYVIPDLKEIFKTLIK